MALILLWLKSFGVTLILLKYRLDQILLTILICQLLNVQTKLSIASCFVLYCCIVSAINLMESVH